MEKQVKSQMTAAQIIDETVAYYGEDPVNRRAYSKQFGICRYKTDQGQKCAYSRCWKRGAYNEKYEGSGVNSLARMGYIPDMLLQKKYQGHHVDFWDDLQGLHDQTSNWNPIKGISREGKKEVTRLKKLYE